MMIKKKRITAALLALGLGAVTMFSQFPVSAAEETAQNTDAAAQTADPSVFQKCRSAPLPCKRSQDHDLPGCS